MKKLLSLIFFLLLWNACGVKKPPVPIYATPPFEEVVPAPTMAPTITPTPTPTRKPRKR